LEAADALVALGTNFNRVQMEDVHMSGSFFRFNNFDGVVSTFVVTPMQISTNDGSGRKGGAANPWILPSAKQLGLPDHPPYAPILECPCTTRINRTTLRVDGDCRPEPQSDLLVTKNPTCQAATYVGGLNCCGDGLYLLDADQTPPPFVDEVFFRFRFYYEDHDPAKHEQIDHVEWAGNGCDSGCNGDCPNKCHHIEWDVIQVAAKRRRWCGSIGLAMASAILRASSWERSEKGEGMGSAAALRRAARCG